MGIPHDYIIYPLDVDERARTERENGELLIILRIPHFQGKEADIPYITVPLGIILTPKYIVTVCRQDNQIYPGPDHRPRAQPLHRQALPLCAAPAAGNRHHVSQLPA